MAGESDRPPGSPRPFGPGPNATPAPTGSPGKQVRRPGAGPKDWRGGLSWTEFLPALVVVVPVIGAFATNYSTTYQNVLISRIGLDVSVWEGSRQDYLLAASPRVMGPVMAILLATIGATVIGWGLAASIGHFWPGAASGRAVNTSLVIVFVFILLGLGYYLFAYIYDWLPRHLPWLVPAWFVSSRVLFVVMLVFVVASVAAIRLGGRPAPTNNEHTQTPSAVGGRTNDDRLLGVIAIGTALLVVLGAYTETAKAAVEQGERDAIDLIRNLNSATPTKPLVIVYSAKDLAIPTGNNGVSRELILEPNSAYQIRYTGLRLLTYNRSRFYLVPTKFSEQTTRIVVLPDTTDIRVEFANEIRPVQQVPAQQSPSPSAGQTRAR